MAMSNSQLMNSGTSSDSKETTSANSSLDERLLNRLPNVRSTSARTDDSPSSVAKEDTTIMRKKTDSNSINTTPTTAYSSSSSFQSTRGNHDPTYAKLQEDFERQLQNPSKVQQRHPPQERIRSVQHRNSPQFSTDTGIVVPDQMDSDSDSGSSAELDSLLDSRIQRLLESPRNNNNSQAQSDLIEKNHKSRYHHDGTPDEPVDLAHPERFRKKEGSQSSHQEAKQQHFTPPRRSSFPRRAPPATKTLSPNHDHHRRVRPWMSSPHNNSSGNLYIPNPRPTITSVGDHSLGRGSSFFNPLGVSPGKKVSESTYKDYHRSAYSLRQQMESEKDDESSLDSLEVLEIWSKQIRSELRNEAMIELAMEAEQAAEAGEERFSSSRPWTMGNDSQELSSPLRRNRSYSEGMTPIKQQPNRSILRLRRVPKVSVRELRNVNEVFPDLDVFHKNLRTHYARNNVERSCLVFEEHANRPLNDFSAVDAAIASVGTMSPKSDGSSKEPSFLDSFSFEMLKQSFSKDTQGGEEGKIGIGDILAEHIRPTDGEHKAPPKQEVPPGLETVKIDPSPKPKRTPPVSTERKKGPAIQAREHTTGQSTQETGPVPRTLFTVNDNARRIVSKANSVDGDEIKIEYSKVTKTPQLDHTNPDFVTPARLRSIRGKESLVTNSVLQTVPSILESASPHRRHLNQFDPTSPVKSDTTPPNLLLPALPLTLGREPGSEDGLKPRTHASSDSQIRASDDIGGPESISDIHVQRQSARTRRTRVSIFSKRQQMTERDQGYDHDPLLSQSQQIVIATKASVDADDDGQPPKEISTPAYHDCTCLSIHAEDNLDKIAIPHPPPNSQDANFDFSSNGGSPRPFTAAMKILADHLSPARSERKTHRGLYVPIKQNDDFMQNFLYCGRRMGPQIDPRAEICSDPCHQGRCDDAIASCYASFVLDDHDADASYSPAIHTNGSQSLFKKGFGQKLESETWFDVATEQVDGVIERLVGSDSRQNPWNVSFQPPSLRKSSGAAKKYASLQRDDWRDDNLKVANDTIQEASISPSNSSVQLSTKSGSRASSPVVALLPAPDRNRFQVIYDNSKEESEQVFHSHQLLQGGPNAISSKHESKNSLLDGNKLIAES